MWPRKGGLKFGVEDAELQSCWVHWNKVKVRSWVVNTPTQGCTDENQRAYTYLFTRNRFFFFFF